MVRLATALFQWFPYVKECAYASPTRGYVCESRERARQLSAFHVPYVLCWPPHCLRPTSSRDCIALALGLAFNTAQWLGRPTSIQCATIVPPLVEVLIALGRGDGRMGGRQDGERAGEISVAGVSAMPVALTTMAADCHRDVHSPVNATGPHIPSILNRKVCVGSSQPHLVWANATQGQRGAGVHLGSLLPAPALDILHARSPNYKIQGYCSRFARHRSLSCSGSHWARKCLAQQAPIRTSFCWCDTHEIVQHHNAR